MKKFLHLMLWVMAIAGLLAGVIIYNDINVENRAREIRERERAAFENLKDKFRLHFREEWMTHYIKCRKAFEVSYGYGSLILRWDSEWDSDLRHGNRLSDYFGEKFIDDRNNCRQVTSSILPGIPWEIQSVLFNEWAEEKFEEGKKNRHRAAQVKEEEERKQHCLRLLADDKKRQFVLAAMNAYNCKLSDLNPEQ